MSVTTTRGPFGGLPLGFVGACVLIFVVERTVERFELDLSQVATMNWSFSKHAARSEAPRAEILCFGTSLIKFGVLPKAIENATGRTAYNLAVCNSHMPANYFLLKRALDAGSKPVALLVDCQDGPVPAQDLNKQAEALRVNFRNWPELLSERETLDLAWNAGDLSFLGSMHAARLLPSYKTRFEIRNLVMAGFQGRDASPRETILVYLRNWNANLGTNVMPSSTMLDVKDPPAAPVTAPAPDKFANGTWTRNRLTDHYTRRFLELANAHEIPVFWIIPPIPEKVRRIRKSEGLDLYFDDLARRAQAISPRLTVIDGGNSIYPTSSFCDDVHMNATGTTAFSANVASRVATALAASAPVGSWVILPDYEPPRGGVAPSFEDLDGSRIAVKEGRIGLRR